MIGIIVMLCIMHYYISLHLSVSTFTLHKPPLVAVSTFTLHKPPLVIGQDRAGECRHGLLDEIRLFASFLVHLFPQHP